AYIPSKCLCTSVATSIGCPWVATSGNLSGRAALEDASRFGPHSIGPEPEESDDEQPDDDPLQRRDQSGRADRGGYEARCLLEADRHQERAEDRADVVALAA